MRRLLTLAAVTAPLLLVAGGVAFADAQVAIGDDGFDPASVTVAVGEPILWTNATDQDVSLVGRAPDWESGVIAPGATYSIKITRKGTYEYASEDGSFQGEIVVGPAGGRRDTGPEARGGGTGTRGRSAKKVVDPAEALPITGVDVTLPGALALLLVALGTGLLLVTHPPRRVRA